MIVLPIVVIGKKAVGIDVLELDLEYNTEAVADLSDLERTELVSLLNQIIDSIRESEADQC